MTEQQAHHQQVHPCKGENPEKLHPWSFLHELQEAQQVSESLLCQSAGQFPPWELFTLSVKLGVGVGGVLGFLVL